MGIRNERTCAKFPAAEKTAKGVVGVREAQTRVSVVGGERRSPAKPGRHMARKRSAGGSPFQLWKFSQQNNANQLTLFFLHGTMIM